MFENLVEKLYPGILDLNDMIKFNIPQKIMVLLFLIVSLFLMIKLLKKEYKDFESMLAVFICSVICLIATYAVGFMFIMAISQIYISIFLSIAIILFAIDMIKNNKEKVSYFIKNKLKISCISISNNKRYDLYKKANSKYYGDEISKKLLLIKYKSDKLINNNFHKELVYQCENKIYQVIENSFYENKVSDKAKIEILEIIHNFKLMLVELINKMEEMENSIINNVDNISKTDRDELNYMLKNMTKDIKNKF